MTTLSRATSQDELHQAGIDVLSSELGVVGFIRFIQQFNKGSGDYTAERAQLHAGKTVDDVMTAIEKVRAERKEEPKLPVKRAGAGTISPEASPDELRRAGLEALRRELGSADFVRFLRQVIRPSGDYAVERAKLAAHLSAEEIFEVIENRPAAEHERNQDS